jgi:outer membrane murein-binding lipoprotein Lpp
MKMKQIGLAILLTLPLTTISCGFLHSGGAPSAATQRNPSALAPNPALRATPSRSASRNPAQPADVNPPEAGKRATASVPSRDGEMPAPTGTMGDVTLGTPQGSLTETLDKTLALLARERADSEAFRKTVGDLKESLAQKDQKIGELSAQIQDSNTKIEKLEGALDKWKEDVLGFRDEMRKAEEAEIDALQQILTLLGKNKEEKKP